MNNNGDLPGRVSGILANVFSGNLQRGVATDYYIFINSKGKIFELSPGVSFELGFTKSDLLNLNVQELIVSNETYCLKTELEKLSSNHRLQGEVCLKKKDGTQFWVGIKVLDLKKEKADYEYLVTCCKSRMKVQDRAKLI